MKRIIDLSVLLLLDNSTHLRMGILWRALHGSLYWNGFSGLLWERRKLQLVAACASKPVVVRYFLLHEALLRSRFATEICIMANGIGFGSA